MDVTSKVLLGLDADGFRRGIQQVDAKLKETSKLFGNLGGLIGATFAVGQITAFASEAFKLGNELQKVEQGFKRIGGATTLDQLRKSTNGLVSDLELMKKATMANNFGIGVEKLGGLLEFAKRRAQETGQEVDYLVESIVTGIGRKSPLILDNLGISASMLRSKLNGVSVEAASVGEVTAAVGEIAQEQLAAMGKATDNASDRVQQLSVKFDNLKASMGVGLQTAALSFYDLFDQLFKDLSLGFEGMIQAMVQSTGTISARRIATIASQGFEPQNVGATEPNLPPGPSVLNFGNFSAQTLSSMKERLAAFNAELENTQIGSARFVELTKNIGNLSLAIDKAMGKIYLGGDQALISVDKLNTKGLKSFGTVTLKAGEILRQTFLPALQGSVGTFEQVQESLRRYNEEMELLGRLGAEFGVIFTSSFNAAMVNGTSFFEEMGNSIKNYVKQMLVALAVTAALALVISSIMPKISFGKAFKGLSSGTGLGSIFGEGGIVELVASLKGFDLSANSGRVNKALAGVR
jgi:hypothetical protein